MLFGTSYLLPLLVLLSIGQSMAGIPGLSTKKKVDPTFGYELDQPGAFRIEGLIIGASPEKNRGAYFMKGRYFVVKDDDRDVKITCGNKETKHWIFKFYTDIYTGDYNMFETKSMIRPFYAVIKKIFSKNGDTCYMVVGPKLGIPLYNYMLQYHFGRQDAKLKFLELIEIIRDMKAKGWAMYDTIRYAGRVTDDRVVFTSTKYLRPIEDYFSSSAESNYEQINQTNGGIWSMLGKFYKKTEPSLTSSQALDYVVEKYRDLAIPPNLPPSYDPRRYEQHSRDLMIYSTATNNDQLRPQLNTEDQNPPPPYPSAT